MFFLRFLRPYPKRERSRRRPDTPPGGSQHRSRRPMGTVRSQRGAQHGVAGRANLLITVAPLRMGILRTLDIDRSGRTPATQERPSCSLVVPIILALPIERNDPCLELSVSFRFFRLIPPCDRESVRLTSALSGLSYLPSPDEPGRQPTNRQRNEVSNDHQEQAVRCTSRYIQ